MDVIQKPDFFAAFAARSRPPDSHLLRPTVGDDGDRLRELLAAKTPKELTVDEIRREVGSNLWMLGLEAFRYFLPAFLEAALEAYSDLSVFASELVGALTEPSRTDVEEGLERVAGILPQLGVPSDITEQLRRQQLEWIDSGTPTAIFHERVDSLTPAEGAAILAFFDALKAAHGADFPFGELEKAIDRYWARFRAS
jgi:hypothetical protein